jgi:hypothetical protein
MRVLYPGKEVPNNAQLSAKDVTNPPEIFSDPTPNKTYLTIFYAAETKFIYWLTVFSSSSRELIPYQAPVNNGRYSIIILSIPNGTNNYNKLTRNNLNTFKLSDLGILEDRLSFYISGLPALPNVLKSNIAYQNLDAAGTLAFCEVNPEICTYKYWMDAKRKFLSEDPNVGAHLSVRDIKRILGYIASNEPKDQRALEEKASEGYEKLLPLLVNPNIRLIFEPAIRDNYPLIINKIIRQYPDFVILPRDFLYAAKTQSIDVMKILINYLPAGQDLTESFLQFPEHIKDPEWLKVFVDRVTPEAIHQFFGRAFSVPVIKYLLERNPELINEIGAKYEMVGEYVFGNYRLNDVKSLINYLNTLPIPQASVDNALINYFDAGIAEEILKKGVSQDAKNHALHRAVEQGDINNVELLRRYL